MSARCKQCGHDKPDNGWVICGDCWHKNIKYRGQCDAMARAFHREFQAKPPGASRETIYHMFSEMRDRRARNPIVSSHQQEDIEE